MPPKKKLRLINSQQKLTSSLFSSGPRQSPETSGGGGTDKQVEINVGEGAKPSCGNKPVKMRPFLHTWTKTYSWLRYDQNNDIM